MAHEVIWLIENHLLVNKYIDTLDMTDFLGVSEKNISMMSQSSNPVHVMADLTKCRGIHPDISRLPSLIQSSRTFMAQPNLGSIVAFGTDNTLVKFLGSMVMQLNKNEWRVFPTYNQAIKHLIHAVPTLQTELEALLSPVTDD